jgi:hypothetical protein
MRIVAPIAFAALSAIARMTASVGPPAVHGQINLIGRDGKVRARAIDGATTIAVVAAADFRKSRRVGFEKAMRRLLVKNLYMNFNNIYSALITGR